jgi:hypothetical protein
MPREKDMAKMKLEICYIFPQAGANGHFDRAIKFLQTYASCPPGMEHSTVIVCNETPANEETRFLFGALPGLRFLDSDGAGMDISGFQKAAASSSADFMVFLGGNTYFRRPGWLTQLVWAFKQHGDTLYGSTGNQGDKRFGVYPHVRTTGWAATPSLVNRHPFRVTNNGQRYPYEHGAEGITTWVLNQNKMAWVVAWDGTYPVLSCDMIPGGFHQANQENVLIGDRLTAPPYHHCE